MMLREGNRGSWKSTNTVHWHSNGDVARLLHRQPCITTGGTTLKLTVKRVTEWASVDQAADRANIMNQSNPTPFRSIPVFFSPAMQAKVESLSPGAHKPAEAVKSWGELGIPLTIFPPTPVTRDELARAHNREHVDAILDCRVMNGYYTKAPDVAASLPYTTGAMLSAAREALRNGQVAVAPTSGFHHAGYAKADAFCTFNGLMVTALALKAEGLAERVGILDLDQHYGDGTEDIIQTLEIDFVRHYTSAEHYNLESQALEFLGRVPELVASMKDCDVVLYQAGADPHVDDPLGGWLNTEQLAERDRLVFKTARRLGIPLAWNLAGGYQKPLRKVLDIHDNTMRACAAAYLGSQTAACNAKTPISSQVSRPVVDGGPGTASDHVATQGIAGRGSVGETNSSFVGRPGSSPMNDTRSRPETPPLTRAGRKVADATLAAAQFKPTTDGKSAIRKFEVHGMAVTECVRTPDAMLANSAPEKSTDRVPSDNRTHVKGAKPETAPLTRAGRKVADATLAAAKFKPTSDGKRAIRQFEVHGMTVTECVDAEKVGAVDSSKK
jgi:acetoin utilization deacetylase AcuC-like enzyme